MLSSPFPVCVLFLNRANIVTSHRDSDVAQTWRSSHKALGAHTLKDKTHTTCTSAAITVLVIVVEVFVIMVIIQLVVVSVDT